METQEANPYKAPEAEVEVAATGKLNEVFERFTAWGVFGLTIITFGIYPIYWLYSRTQRINPQVELKISPLVINGTIITLILSLASNFADFLPPIIAGLLFAASLAHVVFYLIWSYKMRSAIHEYVKAEKGTYAWANAFLTIFGPLYLQYKINKIIDNQ